MKSYVANFLVLVLFLGLEYGCTLLPNSLSQKAMIQFLDKYEHLIDSDTSNNPNIQPSWQGIKEIMRKDPMAKNEFEDIRSKQDSYINLAVVLGLLVLLIFSYIFKAINNMPPSINFEVRQK